MNQDLPHKSTVKRSCTAVRLTTRKTSATIDWRRRSLTRAVANALLRTYIVGAARVELSSSSVSANGREPLCGRPFPQVALDRRFRSYRKCSPDVQLCALLPMRLEDTDAARGTVASGDHRLRRPPTGVRNVADDTQDWPFWVGKRTPLCYSPATSLAQMQQPPARTLRMEVDDEEHGHRRQKWQPPGPPPRHAATPGSTSTMCSRPTAAPTSTSWSARAATSRPATTTDRFAPHATAGAAP